MSHIERSKVFTTSHVSETSVSMVQHKSLNILESILGAHTIQQNCFRAQQPEILP